MKINKSHSRNRSKKIYIIVGLIVALAVAYGLVAQANSLWPFTSPSEDQTSQDNNSPDKVNDVNYDPPTEQEVEDSQNGKQATTEEDKTPTVGDKAISIGVSFADVVDGELEVRAFASNTVEGGGVCTATLTKDSSTVVESSKAFIDSTTSQCRPIYIPVSEFNTKGTWSLVVSYTSSTGTGNSEAIEVNI